MIYVRNDDMTDTSARPSLQAHYDTMWEHAFGAIARGDVDCDTRLAAGPDPRRGISLIARPCPSLQARFDGLLDCLAGAEPRQYRYPAADMHMTILSLLTAGAGVAIHPALVDDYLAAARAAVDGIEAIGIDFGGIALSRGAVMARGIARGPALEILRERLRTALRERGLDGALDRRYRLVTAHMTLFRFTEPLRDAARFAALLDALRDEPLGVMRIEQAELVVNDWYMSSHSLVRVAALPLAGPQRDASFHGRPLPDTEA